MKNYKIFKLMIAEYGLVFGTNQYGSLWIELRAAKKMVRDFHVINNDPRDVFIRKMKEEMRMRREVVNIRYDEAYH